MKSLKIIVYDNGKEVDEINISISKSYIYYTDLHPEIMHYSKEEVLKELERLL